MAKRKYKRGPLETTAEEITPGEWYFRTGTWSWKYYPGEQGLNLKRAYFGGASAFQPIIFAAEYAHAVMFAQGFETGVTAGEKRAGQATAQE